MFQENKSFGARYHLQSSSDVREVMSRTIYFLFATNHKQPTDNEMRMTAQTGSNRIQTDRIQVMLKATRTPPRGKETIGKRIKKGYAPINGCEGLKVVSKVTRKPSRQGKS
jgi:hypothetical protein